MGRHYCTGSGTTAQAPVTTFGERAYVLRSQGTLYALNLMTGAEVWSTPAVGGDQSNIIATEKYIFVSDQDSATVSALNAQTGAILWQNTESGFQGTLATFSRTPAIALAYGQLLVFLSDDARGEGTIRAYDPNTGTPLWEVSESSPGIQSGLVANNIIYYYHTPTDRIRARDALTGALIWSINRPGVESLVAANGFLFVLFEDTIEVYSASLAIFFALVADGADPATGSQTTLFTLVNASDEIANGRLFLLAPDGSPLELPIEDFAGDTSEVPFSIPPRASIKVQTLRRCKRDLSGPMAGPLWADRRCKPVGPEPSPISLSGGARSFSSRRGATSSSRLASGTLFQPRRPIPSLPGSEAAPDSTPVSRFRRHLMKGPRCPHNC